MEYLHKLKEKLCKDMEDMSHELMKKGRLSGGELEMLNLYTDTVKNIGKITMQEQTHSRNGYSGDGSSYGGMWQADMTGYYGNSQAGRGQHWVQGHYSRDGYTGDGNSYGGSYGQKQGADIVSVMEDYLRRNSVDEREKQTLMRCIREMKG